MMLRLPGLHEVHQRIQTGALGGVALRTHQRFDLVEETPMVAARCDGLDRHGGSIGGHSDHFGFIGTSIRSAPSDLRILPGGQQSCGAFDKPVRPSFGLNRIRRWPARRREEAQGQRYPWPPGLLHLGMPPSQWHSRELGPRGWGEPGYRSTPFPAEAGGASIASKSTIARQPWPPAESCAGVPRSMKIGTTDCDLCPTPLPVVRFCHDPVVAKCRKPQSIGRRKT
jgi:hypothetical protein